MNPRSLFLSRCLSVSRCGGCGPLACSQLSWLQPQQLDCLCPQWGQLSIVAGVCWLTVVSRMWSALTPTSQMSALSIPPGYMWVSVCSLNAFSGQYFTLSRYVNFRRIWDFLKFAFLIDIFCDGLVRCNVLILSTFTLKCDWTVQSECRLWAQPCTHFEVCFRFICSLSADIWDDPALSEIMKCWQQGRMTPEQIAHLHAHVVFHLKRFHYVLVIKLLSS